ncbi:MAG: SGNH hydrolase domain-containing protein [Candidatus Rickettsia vulgarisii]
MISRGPAYFLGKGFGIEEEDPEWQGWILENIQKNKFAISKQNAFVEGYVETIEYLLAQGKKVIFVIDFPELGVEPTSCLKRVVNIYQKEISNCLVNRRVVDERQKEYRELVNQIQQKVPSLIIYDPITAFCDEEKCYGKRNDIIYYSDNNHLNLEGSKLLINHFKNWFFDERRLSENPNF